MQAFLSQTFIHPKPLQPSSCSLLLWWGHDLSVALLRAKDNGVFPALLLRSVFALTARSALTISVWPFIAAMWIGLPAILHFRRSCISLCLPAMRCTPKEF
eukprot:SAG22_NODE_404_length_11005_cov_8.751788_8_plen_101_part_00